MDVGDKMSPTNKELIEIVKEYNELKLSCIFDINTLLLFKILKEIKIKNDKR